MGQPVFTKTQLTCGIAALQQVNFLGRPCKLYPPMMGQERHKGGAPSLVIHYEEGTFLFTQQVHDKHSPSWREVEQGRNFFLKIPIIFRLGNSTHFEHGGSNTGKN